MDKVIRDALHGDIEFSAAEMRLIDTPPVQRLRGIKQLGTSSLVYPSAVHTRFEHSLGTCWIAKRLVQELTRAGHRIAPADRLAIPAAALLHDITHIPFGHTFEDERRVFPRHDEDPDRLNRFLGEPELHAALQATGVAERVRAILGPAPLDERPYAQELIAGTICADLLDYLRRDAFHTGLAQAYDDRLFRSFEIADGHLTVNLQKEGLFRHDVLSEVIHLLRVRYNLTERVYYHHAKAVAGAMISKALELALAAGRIGLDDLCRLGDDSFLYLLAERCGDLPEVLRLLQALQARRLYKRVYLVTLAGYGRHGIDPAAQTRLAAAYHYDPACRQEAERRLATALKVPEGAVIVSCPSPRMQLKEAAVPVRIDRERVAPLDSLGNPEVESLGAKYRGIWRFFVCLHRDHSDRFQKAGELAEALFEAPNLIRLQDRGQLMFEF